MSRGPEFEDTPTARAAVTLLLQAGGHSAAGSDDLVALNLARDEVASRLTVIGEEAFEGWLAQVDTADGRASVRDRASDLTNHLIEWRLGDV